jgi:cathepsin B
MRAEWERNAAWWQGAFTEGADPEYEEQILPLVAERLVFFDVTTFLKMKSACFLLAVFVFTLAVGTLATRPLISQQLVNEINSKNVGWTASLDQGGMEKMTLEEWKVLMGVRPGGPKLPHKVFTERVALPESFDARTQWPNCDTIKAIRDQSACGSCWAFGAVEAMSDRYCIHLKKTNLSISAQDLNSCCTSCGFGCGGGFPSAAWQYWANTGIVSEKCSPYSLPSCDHHIPNSPHPCPPNEYPTPPCVKSCKDGKSWQSDKHFGASVYSVRGEQDIMQEIYTNGPVEAVFEVYSDFLSYKTGIYKHVSGQYVGGHAVKIIGWGVENGVKYWLIANSWNTHWGEKGFFRMLKGTNECGIESEADAGIPKN